MNLVTSNKVAHIQLNMTSGLGDLLANFLSCISTAKFLKSLNYYVTFSYSLHGNIYPEGPNILEKVFHSSMFDNFDEVLEINMPNTSLFIENAIFFNWGYLHAMPGVHHIDLYLSCIPENFPTYTYSAERKFRYNIAYEGKISFTENIENKIQKFRKTLPQEYIFLHIRRNDQFINNSDVLINNIKKFITINYKDACIHAGSNQRLIIDELKKENYFFTYSFSDEYDHLSKNIQCIKFIDSFTEMLSIRYAKKILAYNEYGWVSNFLLYALLQEVECDKIDLNMH